MKKFFTLLFSAGCIAAMAQSPFLPGSVVVYRVGDGVAPLRSVSTKVFLDEFSTAGVLIQSVPMPVQTSGANAALTASGSATSEGLLSRSADGHYLMLTGYNTDTGYTGVANSTATLVKRVVGRVDATAAINTSTILGVNSFSGNNIRGAASVDGSSFWLSGAGSGVRYGLIGDTSIRISTALGTSNFRAIGIYGGQLFVTTSSNVTNSLGDTIRLGAVGTGLPTDSAKVVTKAPGLPISGSSPYQFFFADLSPTVAGLDVLYIADDGAAGGIIKFSLVGGSWVSNGIVTPPVTATRGLAGFATGTTVGLVTTTPSKLYSIVDASGYNQPFTGTFTEMATAAANTAYRGVALAPLAIVAPLNLISFKAMLSTVGVNLNWTSANEINVKGFSIERSKDGSTFTTLGSVTAQNRNEAIYSFVDKAPYEGINYYRLKMNDNNGTYKYSNTVSVVNRRSIKADVFPNPAVNSITVSHSVAVMGAIISLVNNEGQQLKTYNVSSGAVQTVIATDKLTKGNYLIIYNNNGEKAVTKFVKQ